jgi:DNA invertase Pin-like site-specific DNA recombinase
MERPALMRLLEDIAQGQIDIVVVYKVDRLTRSLVDFAKIVELFDRHDISFVSITQHFNTTTSMGRLTLNILLSFAQFEREVTGERIRDKIAASKRKGMWMGGLPPLGYDVRDRRLVINREEVKTVRLIFQRYLDLGSVRQLKEALDSEGVCSKRRHFPSGRKAGGGRFSRGALYTLLSNPIYIGQVRHKSARYAGQHDAVIDSALFETVRRRLASNGADRERQRRSPDPSLLTGKLYDDHGQRMTPSHAVKGARRYRYYVSSGLVSGTAKERRGWRLPMREIEDTIINALSALLADGPKLSALAREAGYGANELATLVHIGAISAKGLQFAPERSAIIAKTLKRADLRLDGIALTFALPSQGQFRKAAPAAISYFFPVQIQRRGIEMRLVIAGESRLTSAPDPSLAKALARSRRWFSELASGKIASASKIAARERVSPSYVNRLLRLAHLAPQIVEAIARGTHPVVLTAQKFTYLDPPLEWSAQLDTLGFASPPKRH